MCKVLEYFTNLWYDFFRNNRGGVNVASINRRLEAMANDILLKNDMLKLPVDLVKIAQNNNIDVYYSQLPDGISGAIRYNGDKEKFEILIEETEIATRQRFTLAHELAHYFLEGDMLSRTQQIHFDTLYRKGKNPEEKSVDYLAGALLMDENILKRLYKIAPSIPLLAQTFKVSESAMTVRLMVLGLI